MRGLILAAVLAGPASADIVGSPIEIAADFAWRPLAQAEHQALLCAEEDPSYLAQINEMISAFGRVLINELPDRQLPSYFDQAGRVWPDTSNQNCDAQCMEHHFRRAADAIVLFGFDRNGYFTQLVAQYSENPECSEWQLGQPMSF